MNALFKLIRSVSLNTIMPKTSGFYAVKVGKQSGVFRTWAECQEQVKGYPGAKFKKFSTKDEAKKFVEDPIPVTTSAPQKRKLTQSSSAVTKKRKVEADSSTSKSDSSKGKSDDPLEHTSGDAVVVYTDGCCHFNGMKGSCGGLGVFWGADHPDNLSEKLEGRQSNNRAEIMAVVRALQQAKTKGIKHLEVRTDSNFLISCMTKWIDAWKKRGWLLANGNPVINREELELLDAEQKDIKVTYVYVKGHAGIEGNEQADRLAKQGSKM